MTLAISSYQERVMRQMEIIERHRSVFEEAQRFQCQFAGIQEVERIRKLAAQAREVEHIRKIVELTEVSAIWKSIQSARQRCLEQIERFQQAMEIVDRVRRQMVTVSHSRPMARDKAGASGTGRNSAGKKSAKSSGGDGGGGDSDGDGPHRIRYKKRRPQKKSSTTTTHSPTVAPGTIVPSQSPPTQFPPPPPQNSLGLAYLVILGALLIVLISEEKIYAITVFAILALCLTGNSKVLMKMLTSKALLSQISRLLGKAGEE